MTAPSHVHRWRVVSTDAPEAYYGPDGRRMCPGSCACGAVRVFKASAPEGARPFTGSRAAAEGLAYVDYRGQRARARRRG